MPNKIQTFQLLLCQIIFVCSLFVIFEPKRSLAFDTESENFSSVGNWQITSQHVALNNRAEDRLCRAVGTFDGNILTIVKGHSLPQYGELSLSVDIPPRPSIAGYTGATVGADPRTCATGKQGDAPAGSLRLHKSMPADDICDGIHDWHMLKENDETASLLVDGIFAVKGKILYGSDQYRSYSAHAIFDKIEAIQDKLEHGTQLTIRPDQDHLKPLEISNLDLERVFAEIQKCLR